MPSKPKKKRSRDISDVRLYPIRAGENLTDRLREKRPHVYAAVLRGALAGDPHWAALFLQLTGDLPRTDAARALPTNLVPTQPDAGTP